MLQDMVVAAVNEALRSAQELRAKLGGLGAGSTRCGLGALGLGGMWRRAAACPAAQPNRAARRKKQ